VIRAFSRNLTLFSLAGLGAGLLLGAIGHGSSFPVFGIISSFVNPVGALWVTALQAVVLPLVITHMLAAVVGSHGQGNESMARMGGSSVLLFVGMLAAAGLFTAVAAPALIGLVPVDPVVVAGFDGVPIPDSARAAAASAATAGGGTLGDWVGGLLPRNLFQAAAQGDILSLLLFTVAFGVAVTQLPAPQRQPLAIAFQGLAVAMLTVIRWILVVTPIAVFGFTYALALETGGAAAGLIGAFIVAQSLLMLVVTGLLYPVATLLGRVPFRSFAKALAPAQIVAVSTRSSVAALPALMQGAREHLPLPPAASAFVLPLSNSLFKLNRTVSSTVKLLFLAHIYDISLSVGTLVAFVATVILLSFTSVGVPGGGSAFRTLPAYLAAGVPIAGIIILEAADTIPDVFKTLLNVTGQMSAAALVTRGDRTHVAPAPAFGESISAHTVPVGAIPPQPTGSRAPAPFGG